MSRVDKIRTSLLGKEYETNSCGRCFIVNYKKFNDVTVMFYDPVFTVNITGASSISSSPGTLLFGVESISGEPYSL